MTLHRCLASPAALTVLIAAAGWLAARPAPAQTSPATKEQQLQQAVRLAGNRLLAYSTADARSALKPWIQESHADVQTALGRILIQEKKYGDAASSLRQAARLRPTDPAPQVHLGEALRYAGQEAAAAAAFEEAARIARGQLQANRDNPSALYHLGVALQGLRRWEESASQLERARQLQPENVLPLYQLGVTRALQEKWPAALDLLNRTVERNTGIAYAYYYRGLVASKVGRKDLTINDFHRFLALAPSSPEAPRVQRILQSVGG